MATDQSSEYEGTHDSNVDQSRRRFLGTTAGVSLAALAPASASIAAEADEDTITIVHDTHFHGRFRDAGADDLNIARYYTVVQDILEDADNSMFLGNGDDIAPSLLGLEYEGEHMIEALNYMDLDAVGVGNHEYDFGADVAEERFEESEFPWLVANLLTDEDEPVPGTERWTTFEVGEHTVGVFGLVVEGFHRITDYPEEWQVLEYVESSQEAVDTLREEDGADIVVCASHVSSGVHFTLAEEVDGLDAIVGSHSGVVFDEPQIEHGTIISEFGDEFAHVGAITIDGEGELVDWQRVDLMPEFWDPADEVDEYDEITTRALDDIEEDEGLMELYEEWQVPLDDELEQPFFTSETDLNGSYDNYAVETGFGNLMTDAMAEVGRMGDIDVDAVVQNGGGIRAETTYEAGEISGSAVMETLPFPNEIEVVEVTGEQLIDFLIGEQRPHPSDQFGTQPALQVSGISYEWWGHEDDHGIDDEWYRDGDSAIANVFIDGEPIKYDETYNLASNDYVIGRDPVLSEAEVLLESGQFQGPWVLSILEEWGEVAPEREHRMIRVDEDLGSAEVYDNDDTVDLEFAYPAGGEALLADTFRAVIRTGDALEAHDVSDDGDTVTVSFDAADLEALASSVDDPVLRVFGEYEADNDAWDYGFDIPTSDGYDNLKLKASADDGAVLEAVSDEDEDDDPADEDEDDDPADEDEDDDPADEDGDDGPIDEDDEPDDDVDDGSPGFGPFAALAGGAGGAYLYSHVRGDEEDEPDV